MSRLERFAAPGWLIGAGNMSRCFLLRKCLNMPLHLLVHRVRYVRITVGIGVIGSQEMPGGDQPNCALRSLAFPHSSLVSSKGGTSKHSSFSLTSPLPVFADHEGQEPLSVSGNLFQYLHFSLACSSLRIPWADPKCEQVWPSNVSICPNHEHREESAWENRSPSGMLLPSSCKLCTCVSNDISRWYTSCTAHERQEYHGCIGSGWRIAR
jgi:hypothetical protein